MYHYVEQYKADTKKVTGRQDVSSYDPLLRDKIELHVATRQPSGYRTRQIESPAELPEITPVIHPQPLHY